MESSVVDPALFSELQEKIDADSDLRQEIRDIVQEWEKQQRQTASLLAGIHSKSGNVEIIQIFVESNAFFTLQTQSIQKLQKAVDGHPYWKFNSMWTREVQTAISQIFLVSWLDTQTVRNFENCCKFYRVPVNQKDQDAFQFTIEEYLHALVSVTEELARFAINAVTCGEYWQPFRISKFVKELHAGFQLLNLKNDTLRRRVDSVKYNVKKIEDVVYDLSLRGLAPKD